jgi:hypothetical protein
MNEHSVSLFTPRHRATGKSAEKVVIHRFFCPITYNYEVKISVFRRLVLSIGSRLLFWLTSPWVFAKIIKISPDIIHLNSLVLSDVLFLLRFYKFFRKVAIVSHVREMLDTGISPAQKSFISTCDYFIFIDKAVQQRFEQVTGITGRSSIVQNPFKGSAEPASFPQEMRHVETADKTVFAIAGRVEHGKGVLEICNAFTRNASKNAVLLIVGGGPKNFIEQLKSVESASNGAVVYVGEIPDLQSTGFFAKIDYLVRGEAFFCTGRTVYESLYSGSGVIVPGLPSDVAQDEVLSEFKERVFCYPPGDFPKFMNVVNALSGVKVHSDDIGILSNYERYSVTLNKIYSKVSK